MNTPIFIAAKNNSVRCPNKNLHLFPYVISEIDETYKKQIIVITDSEAIINLCLEYNISYYKEDCIVQVDEFHAVYNYLTQTNNIGKFEDFVILPLTQPFRNSELLKEVLNTDITNYDVITSFITIQDRHLFYLNDDLSFKLDADERKGSLCEEIKMVDGSIYRLTTLFLKHIIAADNTNNAFWNKSKKFFIENKSDIYLDVDTPKDLRIFKQITNKK